MKLAMLIYHDVVEPGAEAGSGFAGPAADSYKLTVGHFRAHLDAIHSALRERRPVRLDTAPPHLSAQEPLQTALSFDDGGTGAIQHTADLLEERGWHGHFFITTDRIGTAGFMSGPQLRELHARGHVLGSHSASHPARMTACSDQQLREEWSRSLSVLADLLGERVTLASVPGGYYSRRVAVAAADQGVTFLATSEPRVRLAHVGHCLVAGRFSIVARTPAAEAGRLAVGHWRSSTRQAAVWKAKKLLKAAGGRYWLAARQALFARRRRRSGS